MRLRIKPAGLAVYLCILIVLITFSGLAGYVSVFIAVFLPVLSLISLVHVWYSWAALAFHQTFSTDHPVKGETVLYSLHLADEKLFPLSAGFCSFSNPGSGKAFVDEISIPLLPSKPVTYEEKIRCAYRGIYIMGLTGIRIRSVLGLFETEIAIEPRIFYVYPELVKFTSPLERLARSSGITEPDTQSNKDDITIFEYLLPLREETSVRSIAWKRWAATGIPSRIVHGRSRSPALRIVLDLWPGDEFLSEIDKLAAEDLAMTAVFSVMQYMAQKTIPVSFYAGEQENPIFVDNIDVFQQIFDQSTGILFNDASYPGAAFTPGSAVLLISTRPLEALFSSYEDALQGGFEPHFLSCPPPSMYKEEKCVFDALTERRRSMGSRSLLRITDTKNGAEEVVHAFSR
ncbi:MAG TPA: hypothetical protein PLU33_07190 [Treponemataceae bacterium]|nr:hypothetical protein [Treponemataceae bacterium]HQL04911.1 hypothetical protein [Treponemataceae bacterium]